MKKVLAAAAACLTLASCGVSYSWKAIPADGHRTGVTATTADNVVEALGTMDGAVYNAPNGQSFTTGATPLVADLLIEAQPPMAQLKQVIGFAPQALVRVEPECALYDFAVDQVMAKAEEVFGEHVDVGMLNVGGVRCNIPEGDILMDDIVSMFPFKNYLTLIKLSGKRLREIFTQMAERHPEIIGGARIVIEDHKLVSAEVGGQPLDDEKIYNFASIDFLLNGGDRYFLGKDVESVQVSDVLLIQAILPAVMKYQEEGKPFTYKADGRITVR